MVVPYLIDIARRSLLDHRERCEVLLAGLQPVDAQQNLGVLGGHAVSQVAAYCAQPSRVRQTDSDVGTVLVHTDALQPLLSARWPEDGGLGLGQFG